MSLKKGDKDVGVLVNIPPKDESIVSFSNFDRRGYPQKAIINKYTTFTGTNKVWDYLLATTTSTSSEYGSYLLKIKEVTIPDEVTEIGNGVFSHLINLEKIILPSNLKKLGGQCFNSCTKLNNINLPESLKTLETSVFFGCTNLTSIKLPLQLFEIKDTTFYNCTNLMLAELPETIEKLGSSTFNHCKNITLTELPKNLKVLGGSVFQGCSKITIKKIPDGVTNLNSGSYFYECVSITEMEMPILLKYLISSSMFAYCSKLKKVKFHSIEEKFANFSYQMFYNCTSLVAVLLDEIDFVLPLENVNAFANTPIANGTGYVYVKDELVDSYKTATNWSTYANQIKGISEYVE